MDPFPHDAPKATISPKNLAGTDGFEFVEFAHSDPDVLRDLFSKMGFTLCARHKVKDIELWQQGDVTYIVNAQEDSFADRFSKAHGPCASSMAWRVVDAKHALRHAVQNGAIPYEGKGKCLEVPAIYGIGGSLIYFVDQKSGDNPYEQEYDWLGSPKPEGVGFYYLDHLTHNVFRGNMDKWFSFYEGLFNFREIQFFLISRGNIPFCLVGRLHRPVVKSAFL